MGRDQRDKRNKKRKGENFGNEASPTDAYDNSGFRHSNSESNSESSSEREQQQRQARNDRPTQNDRPRRTWTPEKTFSSGAVRLNVTSSQGRFGKMYSFNVERAAVERHPSKFFREVDLEDIMQAAKLAKAWHAEDAAANRVNDTQRP